MRKLFVSNLMSLDGFFEGPNHEFNWFMPDEEFFDYAKDMLRSVDTILFGRATYEHMAAYWPSAERDEIAEKMNGLQKLVVSSTLKKTEWNNSTLITGDFVQEISRLKEEPGKDIVILGSATLASDLLQRGLIDEYRVDPRAFAAGAWPPAVPGHQARNSRSGWGGRNFYARA